MRIDAELKYGEDDDIAVSTTYDFIDLTIAIPLVLKSSLVGGGSLSSHSMKEDEGMMIDRECLDVRKRMTCSQKHF